MFARFLSAPTKGAAFVPLTVGATLAIFATSTPAQSAEPLVIGQAGDPVTLDAHGNNGIVEASVQSNIFETLVTLDKKMEIQPALATRWENPEPDRWVFHLRPGVKFQNGAPLTAQDVAFSFQRLINWKPFGVMTGLAFYFHGVKSVTALDPLTVELRTSGPFATMLRNMRTAYIVNEAYIEKVTAEKGIEEVGRSPMGTGPFKFVEWATGDHMTLDRFADYWGTKAGVERVIFRPIANNATRTAALLSGELGIATELPPLDVPRVKTNPNTRVVLDEGMRTINYKFDSVRAETPGIPGMPNPLRDVRVGEAINYAIDVNAIVKIIMNGFARPSTQLGGHQHFGWSPAIERLPYDPAKAKQLLAEAGYPHGFPLRIDSSTNRYVNDEQVCLAVAQMVTKIGIQATCRARPKEVAFKEFYDSHILCCSMFVFSFVTPTADMSGNLETNFHTPTADGKYGATNGGNPGTPQYSNLEADRLIEAASLELDAQKRLAILRKASETIMADYAIAPLYYQNDIYGMSSKLDWVPRPDDFMTMWDAKWR